jgi:nucleoside-diphosphate-sugar epimerase
MPCFNFYIFLMAKKKILILGAAGFIGRNLAEFFSQNKDLDVLGVFHKEKPFDYPGLKWIQADLTLKNKVNQVVRGVDVIIQAAATTSGSKDIINQPHIHITDNAVMNSLIFRSAYENNVSHVLFFSCSIIYPPSLKNAKESDFKADSGMHLNYFGAGWTKIYLEKMCEFYSKIGRTKYTVIRHSNNYGPYDKFDLERSHVFGATMTKVLGTQDDKIVVWGNGEEERDLLYISDLVDFVKLAIEKQNAPFCLCNVGSGRSISVSDLVKKIILMSGKKVAIEYDKSKPSIKTSLSLDCTKAKIEFGWNPKVAIDEGIQKTMDWFQANN